jgi:myosin-crossreactive antigen
MMPTDFQIHTQHSFALRRWRFLLDFRRQAGRNAATVKKLEKLQRLTQINRRYFQGLAVFCNGTPRDHHALFT